MTNFLHFSVITDNLLFVWPFSNIATAFLIAVGSVCSVLFSFLIYSIIDTSFLPKIKGQGKLMIKKVVLIEEAFGNGDISLIPEDPLFYDNQSCFLFQVKTKDQSPWIMVKKDTFDRTREDDFLDVEFSIGRFSKKVFLEKIL